MTPDAAFTATAATWQNFYLLVGTAAATLIGLMFVAVSFGAGLVGARATATARAFLDPPFTHFVTVLFLACLMVSPAMSPWLLGGAVLAVTVMRTFALVRVRRALREAHRRFNDLELSDWLMGLMVPALCYVALIVTGAGFLTGHAAAFRGLALVILAILMLGVFGAWELMLWLAFTHIQSKNTTPPQ